MCFQMTVSTFLPLVSPPSWPHSHQWKSHGGGEGVGGSLGGPEWQTWSAIFWGHENRMPLPDWPSEDGGPHKPLCETPPPLLLEEGCQCTGEDGATPVGRDGHHQICQRYVARITTDKWWVASDVYLPEEVGHVFCACDYVLALHVTTFLPQQPHNFSQGSPFSWTMRNLKGISVSNMLPVEHTSSLSGGFFKQSHSLSDLGVE